MIYLISSCIEGDEDFIGYATDVNTAKRVCAEHLENCMYPNPRYLNWKQSESILVGQLRDDQIVFEKTYLIRQVSKVG